MHALRRATCEQQPAGFLWLRTQPWLCRSLGVVFTNDRRMSAPCSSRPGAVEEILQGATLDRNGAPGWIQVSPVTGFATGVGKPRATRWGSATRSSGAAIGAHA